MTQSEKILLTILGTLGAFYIWSRSKTGQSAASYVADDYGTLTEYVGEKAAQVVEQARDVVSNLTRGERNNNPGNIRRTSDVWVGLADPQNDRSFFSFTDPTYGIRALAVILRNYAARYGLDTVQGLISRWAPNTENPTSVYVQNVSRATGFPSTQPLDMDSPDTLTALASAIIQQENGRVIYDLGTITAGVNKALT